MKTFLLATLCLCSASAVLADSLVENWPSWRGPNDSSVVAAGEFPTELAPEENLRWKVELPGRGSSTPAVWGDQIFVTCEVADPDGDENAKLDAVVCYDFAGKPTWDRTLGPGRAGKHANGSGSNPSPVTDGKHLVVYFKSGRLACLDFAGEVLWEKNLQELYGEDTLWWDLGTSPVLAGDRVIVAVMQEGKSYLVALQLADGEILWNQPRQYETSEESDQAYTTPHVIEQNGKQVIVTWGADHLTGHDTETGKQLWESGGFNPQNTGMWRVIASAAVDASQSPTIAVVPYGRGEFLAAIDLTDAEGDITEKPRYWQRRGFGSDVPSPLVHENQVILLTDKGEVYALDRATGETLWKDDFPRSRDKYYASPVLAGDLLYCVRQDGAVMVANIEDKFELLAENELGESVIATPVLLRDSMLVRGEKHLYLFGK